ncbi:hypothetical protein OBBRIDRAFT_888554 [Obba rivulosa]|uniref:Uncharacterized protein n=1 Tax=Obba rivulosa TaxID=1052685 RepID=A0A8E2AZ16_9APHY|nr:hypothetical protein OBBRIDRAFT_888554 [Obba rivulosa]
MDVRIMNLQLKDEATVIISADEQARRLVSAAIKRGATRIISRFERKEQRLRRYMAQQLQVKQIEITRLHENAREFVRRAEDRAVNAEREVMHMRSEMDKLRVELENTHQELHRSRSRATSAEKERDELVVKIAAQDTELANMTKTLAWLQSSQAAGPSWSQDKTDDVGIIPGILSDPSRSSFQLVEDGLVASGLYYVEAPHSDHDDAFMAQYYLGSPAHEQISDSAVVEISASPSASIPSSIIVLPEGPPSSGVHSPFAPSLIPDIPSPHFEPEDHEPHHKDSPQNAHPPMRLPRGPVIRIPAMKRQLIIHAPAPAPDYRRRYIKPRTTPLDAEEKANGTVFFKRRNVDCPTREP